MWYSSNMKKTVSIIAILIILILIGITIYYSFKNENRQPLSITEQNTASTFDPENTTYTIDGKSYEIADGIGRTPAAPDSASMIVTRYFGNEAVGDLNGDGMDDIAYLITQETGGSGLFYYAVVALKTNDGYKLTDAFLIGDRIAPQSTDIKDGVLLVNYADRASGEPMSAQPSIGKTLRLKVGDNITLEAVAN